MTPGEEDGSGEERSALWDHEPFLTFRSEPLRFAVGLPVVFLGGMGFGLLLVEWSLRAALAVQLTLQTVGFLWLYVPAYRRRARRGSSSGEEGGPGERPPERDPGEEAGAG